MHPRTRLVYFYFLRVELLLKTWSQGRRHIVRLPWQRYICRSKYGCFCISPKVTYLHTKIEEGLKFFISNFASLSWRIALKILGAHFTHNPALFYKMNFETIEKALRESVKGWSWRGLTLLGRIQVIKSFAIPKILYRASLISTKKDCITKKISNFLYSLVWKGKDKVKRNARLNSLEKGGLNMPDIESMTKTQRVLCIKKFLETNQAGWKFFLEFCLKKVGGKFLFQCNFDFTKLPIALPDFYKECISTWSSLSEDNPSSLSDIVNQVDGEQKTLQKLYSKSLYQIFVSKISSIPTVMKKYDKAFNTDTFHLDWEKIYLLPFKTTLHIKLREFQYKILNRILYTNVM